VLQDGSWLKWFGMAQDGSGRFRIIQDGSRWFSIIGKVRNRQRWIFVVQKEYSGDS
jgi:hypothetical protein